MKIKDKNVGVINPSIDEYINKLLGTADEYNLNGQAKKILNYVIYLILNENFQYMLRSCRIALYMPIDGFKNEEEQALWEVKFRKVVNKYHNGETIDKGTQFLIDEIEREKKRPLVDKEPKEGAVIINMCSDSISVVSDFIYKFLNFRNTKNIVYWMIIIKRLLLFNTPKEVVNHINNWSTVFGVESLNFEQKNNRINMSITLYPDTTIKDIKRLIEKKRNLISNEIKKIKGAVRKNESKTDDIKRDYLIYRTYINHKSTQKRGDNIHFNIKKEEAVKNMAEEITNGVEYLELESIRKIVSRINKRIKNTFQNSQKELDRFTQPINPKYRT